MFSSTFIFAKKEFDDEFHELDGIIADAAKSIPGYIGEECWESPTTGLTSNVYYWENLEALDKLMKHPKHQEAKLKNMRWLESYKVVIAEVVKEYGQKDLGLTKKEDKT